MLVRFPLCLPPGPAGSWVMERTGSLTPPCTCSTGFAAICRELAPESIKPAAVVVTAKTVSAVVQLARADRRLAATCQSNGTGTICSWSPHREGDMIIAEAYESGFTGLAVCCRSARATRPRPRPAGAAPLWHTPPKMEHAFPGSHYRRRCRTAGVPAALALDIVALASTTEHALPVFAYGTGANGKSTFINTIVRIFGDYATVATIWAPFHYASYTERHP